MGIKRLIEVVLNYLGKNSIKRLLWYFGIRAAAELGMALSVAEIEELFNLFRDNLNDNWFYKVILLLVKIFIVSGDIELFYLCLGAFIFVGGLYYFERKFSFENHQNYTKKIFVKAIQDETSIARFASSVRTVEHPLLEVVNTRLLEVGHCIVYGQSFCGKTTLAKSLLGRFRENGYHVKIVSSINAASEFLLTGDSNKLCLLEDPFGHNSFENTNDTLDRLDWLIRHLYGNKNLIVTCRTLVFDQVFRRRNTSELIYKHISTVDITNNSKEFLEKVWNTLSDQKPSLQSVTSKIFAFIEDTTYHIYPGHLWILSNQGLEVLHNASFSRLGEIAKVEASEVARRIVNQGREYTLTYVSIGLLGNTINTINFSLLRYLLKYDGTELEGVLKKEPLNPKMLEYNFRDGVHKIDLHLADIINEFTEKGFFRFSGRDIYFVHPHYIEVFYSLFNQDDLFLQEVIGELYVKAVFNDYPENAFNASKLFYRLYRLFDEYNKKKLIKLAINVLDFSLYPKVREQAFVFLSNIKEYLSLEERESLYQNAKYSLDGLIINWSDPNNPALRYDSISSILELRVKENSFKRYDKLTEVEFNISDSHTLQDYYECGKNILFLDSDAHIEPGILKHVVDYLQSTAESFTRTLGAKIAFYKYNRLLSIGSIKNGLNDYNPSVVVSSIKFFLENINMFSGENKSEITDLILKRISDELVAVRSAEFVCAFGLDYTSTNINWRSYNHDQKVEIWNSWAPVLAGFLDHFPYYMNLPNTPRFESTLSEGKNYLSKESKALVLHSYNNYLIKLADHRVYDDYLYSIVNQVISFTEKNKKIRLSSFERILMHESTDFALEGIRWLLYNVQNLSTSELQYIRLYLENLDRKDRFWFYAFSALILSDDYWFIIEGIEEVSLLRKSSISTLFETVDEKLIFCFIAAHLGYPQVKINFSHRTNNEWGNELFKAMIIHGTKYSELLVKDLLVRLINGFKNEQSFSIFQELMSKASIERKNEIVKYAITYTINITENIQSTKEVWEIIIQSYSSDLDILTDLIIPHFYEFQSKEDDVDEILDYLNTDNFAWNHIFPKIPNQRKYTILIIELLKSDNIQDELKKEKELQELMLKESLKIKFLKEPLKRIIKEKKGLSDSFVKLLTTLIDQIESVLFSNIETRRKHSIKAANTIDWY